MSEMVKRVAQAIREADWAPEFPGYEAFARAAIAAMREPTGEMKEAALAPKGWTMDGYPNAHDVIEDKWRAMIDAALADAPSGGDL